MFDPRARQAHLTFIKPTRPRVFEIRQVLIDDKEENLWNLEAVVDLTEPVEPGTPLLALERIGT